MVYNVHCLGHLAEDALVYGQLDNFSAFPFENYMQYLKKLIRGKNRQLEQVVSRVKEIECADQFPKMFRSSCTKYSFMFKYWVVKKTCGDNCYLTKSREIVLVRDFCQIDDSGERNLAGVKFLYSEPFLRQPLNTSNLNIVKVRELSEVFSLKTSDLIKKCVLLPLQLDKFVCIPMIE
jgi:hypothetical protein